MTRYLSNSRNIEVLVLDYSTWLFQL